MAERFGPIGNERYREYLKDIHGAGTHLVSLLNDLLDLSKVETGKLDLSFGNVGVNDLTQQCVGIMQPQANRARIIIRTSLTPALPQVVADERSLRQIVLNLLANSIKFTGPGGQVIVSTAVSDSSEVVLRVRDTGVGMSEKDIEAALEPFRQVATSRQLGLRRNRPRPAADQGAGRGQPRQFQHQERAERRHPGRNRLSAEPRRRELACKRPKAIHRPSSDGTRAAESARLGRSRLAPGWAATSVRCDHAHDQNPPDVARRGCHPGSRGGARRRRRRSAAGAGGRRVAQHRRHQIPAAARGLRRRRRRSARARSHPLRPHRPHRLDLRGMVRRRRAEGGDRLDDDRRRGFGKRLRRPPPGSAALVRRPHLDLRRDRIRHGAARQGAL